ncbi:MAG: hypothetical protein ACRED8_04630, partial [Caulobacteraceae bacterium]
IYADKTDSMIADSGTLQTFSNGRRRIWIWMVTGASRDPPARRSSMEGLEDINCAERTLALISWVTHDSGGVVTGSEQPANPQAQYAAPQTNGAVIVDFACADPGERSHLAIDLTSVGSDPVRLGEAAVELARESPPNGESAPPPSTAPRAAPSPVPEERNVPKYFSPQP